MEDRAVIRDSPGGERSMAKTVTMFRILTGLKLSEEQGWKFMECLKMVRSEQGEYCEDDYVDGGAYAALAGEAAARTRGSPPVTLRPGQVLARPYIPPGDE